MADRQQNPPPRGRSQRPPAKVTSNRLTALPHPALVVVTGLIVHCFAVNPAVSGGPGDQHAAERTVRAQLSANPVRPRIVSNSDLPPQVAAVRRTLLDIAGSGHLEELQSSLTASERNPVLPDANAAAKFAEWRAASPDGKGFAILAIVTDLLALDAAVVEAGPDAENGRLYVWPYLSELPLDKLPAHAEVDLLRLVSVADAQAMKAHKRWTGWRLAIGADGVWRLFAKAN